MEFGQILRKLRTERGLTQQELADIVKISKSSISYYENSKKIPSPIVVAQFAKYFDVTLDYLMDIETPTNSKTFSVDGLTPEDIRVVQAMIDILRAKNTRLEARIEKVE